MVMNNQVPRRAAPEKIHNVLFITRIDWLIMRRILILSVPVLIKPAERDQRSSPYRSTL